MNYWGIAGSQPETNVLPETVKLYKFMLIIYIYSYNSYYLFYDFVYSYFQM